MKKRIHGPSLYFATDKNIFDALNQRKVDIETVMQLFEARNIIVSSKTKREDLARYFSRLNHDFDDHQSIAARLGIAPRRERVTSMDVAGVSDVDDVNIAIQKLKSEREGLGEFVQVSRDAGNITVAFQYTTVDYSRSEFSQVQVRDGMIEFLATSDGYTVRSTQNEIVAEARDELLKTIETSAGAALTKKVVSLTDVKDHRARSRFFDQLSGDLPGHKRIDVLAAYVYKPRPENDESDDSHADGAETHVEKVSLRGVGINDSEVFKKLLDQDEYYVTKLVWTLAEVLSTGSVYEIEAAFDDPKDCSGFSFILSGVYPVEKGIVAKRKRTPLTAEVDKVSRLIDRHSREISSRLKAEIDLK